MTDVVVIDDLAYEIIGAPTMQRAYGRVRVATRL
jgi:hypothetical protein